jgi:hypothetical protein
MAKNTFARVYDVRDAQAREYGLAPNLWTVAQDNGDPDMVIARSVPRGVIRNMPRRHFVPANLVADLGAALAEYKAKGGQP